MTTVNNLPQSTRVDWSNKRAWSLLQRAKPFMLSAKDGTYFVQSGGETARLDDDGRPTGGTVAAAKLLDLAKRPVGR